MKQHLNLTILFFTILSSISYSVCANVVIPVAHFHLDSAKHLIVINQDIATLNSTLGGTVDAIECNSARYTLSQSISEFSSNHKYSVVDGGGIEYSLYISNFPIIHIKTDKILTKDDPQPATFSLIENDGKITDSNIGISLRGSSSLSWVKKQFKLVFWEDESGENTKDISFFQMRSDDKWNLQSMYNEPLRLNSKTANELWMKIHQIYYQDKEPEAINGIRMQYVELFFNNEYRGLYCLSERIDRKQLKLKKHNGEIRGELYKGVGWQSTTFSSIRPFDNTSELWSGFEYKHPDEEIRWDSLYSFVDFVINSTDIQFNKSYRTRFDMTSAVDYFLFINLLRATDNLGKNIYIGKYKKGEPYFYVPWDLDGILGTIWNGTQENVTNDLLFNGFYKRLLKDQSDGGFVDKANKRWAALRKDKFSAQTIRDMIEGNHFTLKDNLVYERESIAWEDYTYQESHLDYIFTWLDRRLKFLDEYFKYNVSIDEDSEDDHVPYVLYDRLSKTLDVVAGDTDFELYLYNIGGELLLNKTIVRNQDATVCNSLAKGAYILHFRNQSISKTQKIIVGG